MMATINQEVPVGKLDYVRRWVEAHELYFDYYTHHARAMALVEAEENNSPQSSSMQNAINNEVLKKYYPQVTSQAKDVLTVASYENFLKKYSDRASRNATLMANVEAHESYLPSQAKLLSRVETDHAPALMNRVSTNTFGFRPVKNPKLRSVLPSPHTMSPMASASRSAGSGAAAAAREQQDDLRRPVLENSGAAAERHNLWHRPKRP